MVNPARIQAIVERTRDIPCVRSLGLNLVEFDEGYCKLTAIHDRNFDGLPGSFHGGMLANVADCVAWFTIATRTGPDEPMLTSDLSIRYLSPCYGTVTGVGRLIKLGRTMCPVNVELYDSDGKQVAVAQVAYIRLSNLKA